MKSKQWPCTLGFGCGFLLLVLLYFVMFTSPPDWMRGPRTGSAWLEGTALAGEQDGALYDLLLLVRAPSGANDDLALPPGGEVSFTMLEADHTLQIDNSKWLILRSCRDGGTGVHIENRGVEMVLGRFSIDTLTPEELEYAHAGELYALTSSGSAEGLLMRVSPEMELSRSK